LFLTQGRESNILKLTTTIQGAAVSSPPHSFCFGWHRSSFKNCRSYAKSGEKCSGEAL